MKKITILLAVAVALSLVSCNRSGLDPENTGDKGSELSEDSVFWGVVGQLVSQKDITPEYKGKTFKATIGSPEGADESVRVVALNSLAAAVEHFNTLTDAGITATTASKTWQNSVVGSLTWNLTKDNTSWATVDVNVPAVPGLSKIIYRSPEQGDVNGSVGNHGSAYYRFGDVIKKTRTDGIVEYWVCVRPAFDPEGKGDTHFVCVSPLPEEKLWPYNSTKESQHGKPWKASNKMEYAFPENIGKQDKWVQDFAELLYAIVYPSNWFTNITNYSTTGIFGGPDGLPIFSDFHVKNIKYHNADFWKNVQLKWREKDLIQKILGISYDELEYAIRPLDPGTNQAGTGLHFLYYTFSWSTSYSNSPKLYQLHYGHGTDNDKKNMHQATSTTVSSQVVVPNNLEQGANNYPFNFKTEVSQNKPYVQKPAFFGDNHPRWVIRYATGEELSSTNRYDNQQPIPGFTEADEVYRYYRDVFPDKSLLDAPEVTEKSMIVNDRARQNLTDYSGTSYYHLGDILQDQNGHKWIVVRPSGNHNGDFEENSPFTELVSFEGIQISPDGKTASNIVTRDQALRVVPILWFLATESMTPYGLARIAPIHNDMLNNAHVVPEQLFVTLLTEIPGHPEEKYKTNVASVAYYEPGATKQRLLRYIVTPTIEFYPNTTMYDLYPAVPHTSDNDYWSLKWDDFTDNSPVYLQDMLDQKKIDDYGDDFLARAPLNPTTVPRVYRTTTDPAASQLSNYLYNMNTWANNNQPLGMWNDPVLLMRATVLYDRGTPEHATASPEGLLFSEVSKGRFNNPELYNQYTALKSEVFDFNDEETRHLNGEPNAIPGWKEVWGK